VEIVDLKGKSLDPGTVVSTTLSVPISGTRIGGAPVFETLASNPNIITTEEMHDRFGDSDLALKFDEVTRLRLNDFRRHHVGLLVAVVVDHEIFKTIRIPEDASQDLVVAGMTPQELNELVTLVSTLPLPVPLIVVEVTRAG
jgi:preprotein translocase subunit SecD